MLLRINVGSDYQERYTVDADFRVSSAIRTIGTRTYTTSYGYNEASQLKQLTYPSTRIVDVGYDSVGRLNSLVSPPSNGNVTYLSSVTYNVAGQATGDTLGNGVSEIFGYDANRMQLTSQKAGTASPYTNRMNLTYGYQATSGQMGSGSTAGNAGQLMGVSGTINSTAESAAYIYDNLGRLVTSNQTSNGSSAQRRFAYDRWGNRTGGWDATSGGNQIQSVALQQSGGVPTNRITSVTSGSTLNYSYDSTGNVTNDGVHTYTYDSENRVASVDGGSTASSAYDHQNRRYKKTVGSTVTHYLWQGSQVLAEHNGSTGVVLVDYVHSGGRMIAAVASSGTQYFLSDRLSLRITLDSSGSVTGRQAHLPFGEDFAESGAQQKQHFTSYARDSESGTDYAVNRQYAQSIGRFNRPDPFDASNRISNPQSLNRYSYAQNDPTNAIDPLGLLEELVCETDEEGHTECEVEEGKGRTDDEKAGVPPPGRNPRGPIGQWSKDKRQSQMAVVEALANTVNFQANHMFEAFEGIGGQLSVEAAEIRETLERLSAALSTSNAQRASRRANKLGRRLGDLVGGLPSVPDAGPTLRDRAEQGIKDVNEEIRLFAQLFNHCSRTLTGEDRERLNRLKDKVQSSAPFYRAFYNGFLRATEPTPI